MKQIFEVRAADRDASFLRRFLTEELMREMDLFQYQTKGNDLVIAEVSDQEGWRKIKETLIKNVGMGTVPVIKIEDSRYGDNRTLYLKHDHDGRDLHLEYAERTLGYLYRLWGREVGSRERRRRQAHCDGLQRPGDVHQGVEDLKASLAFQWARMCCAVRVANAMTVICGGTATDVGNTLASAT